MKKILIAVMFGFMAIAAHAEATFEQVQTLIEQHQYQAAEKGLEVIIQNHPKSAKAFYAMAQAQAGLGNQEKAQKALDIATGLNPTLDFAPASSVASLKQAITPQTKKIEAIEESHALRNFVLFAMFAGFAVAMYFLYSVYARNRDEEEGDKKASGGSTPPSTPPSTPSSTPEVKAYASTYTPRAAYQGTPRTVAPAPAPAPAPTYSAPAPTHTTVVNNNSGSNDLLTGVLIGNMLGDHHHHDTTRVVEREVVREVPSRSSTWDDTPAPTPSRSSSWDDTPSKPSRSSSWDDDSSSSSKSSSSWSSSSDSSSSSSWDSGSSSSDSSSSSSWD